MSASTKFWDRMAAGYARKPVSNQAVYEKKLEKTQTYFNSNTKLFEFGCGTGTTAIYHAPFVKHIYATDTSANMLEIARSKMEEKGIDNITFEQATIESIEIPDQSYDVVLGLSVLHLLKDREASILKVYRMLKPGGVFISSTVCLTGAMTIMKPLLAIGTFLKLLPLIRFISPKTLQKDMLKAGFQNELAWHPEKSDAIFIIARKPAE